MRISKQTIYRLLTIIAVAMYSLHSSSCASTKAAPSGGPKDTIPPVAVKMVPADNTMDFPLENGHVQIFFDEYVQIKDANKNFLLSPPQKKSVKTRIKGKSVIATFQETLDSNTTYSLTFGEGIVDNNEGNILYGLSYTFSTGSTIDSMMLSGTVLDATTLFPIKGATVALYANAKDSSVIVERPSAIAKTDSWGYFTVRNIKSVPYSIFAYTDDNNNYRYDQGTEKIAFHGITVVPTNVMHPNALQLKSCGPKDTLAAKERPSDIELYLFSEKPSKQFIKEYKRFSKRGAFVKFNAPDSKIDSISIEGFNDEKIIAQFNILKDSLNMWLNEGGSVKDTLLLAIKYHKTDSTGNLSPAIEKLKLVAPVEKKDDKKDNAANRKKVRKDLLNFDIMSDKTKVEQEGVVLVFKEPLVVANFDTVSFKMSTPKKIVTDHPFKVIRDSIEINKYTLKPTVNFVKGNDYSIYIPTAAFRDINGFTNDSTLISISLPTDDNLSSIELDIRNVSARYIVELVNENRSTVYRKYVINEDSQLQFPYLKSGKYSVRITEDINSNGLFDTGDLLHGRQPEKVLLYTMPGGGNVIQLNERTDIVQEIDIKEMFK